MTHISNFRIIGSLFTLISFAALRADVTMPALFSEHAVLQKSDNVPIWGKAAPGEAITVTMDKASATATAGTDGKWKTKLDLSAEGPGPFNLVVQGQNTLTIPDVVIGEVWVCGGQSNMDFILRAAAGGKEEVAASANPMLRQFKVKLNASPIPVDDVDGKWVLADPKTSDKFSAVAYYFGKDIQHALNVPVGLVNDCVGGTCIEAWTSSEALDTDPDLKAGKDAAQKARQDFDAYGVQYRDWMKQNNREDHPHGDPATYAAPAVDTKDWTPVQLPGPLSKAGLPDAGAIWIRKTIPLTPGMVNHAFDLRLGDIRDFSEVYVDGIKIGTRDMTAVDQRFSGIEKLKEATIAVRIFNAGTSAGLYPSQDGRFSFDGTPLYGPWLAKVETPLPPLDDSLKSSLPQRPAIPLAALNVAGYLFNGMINPIIPYAMRGVIWYQGEQNWNHGFQYRTAFPLLIKDWRNHWAQGDFPFYYCQIASFNGHAKSPGQSWLAEVREAQTMTLSQPSTGEAILIDIGEEGNVHPTDKVDVGDRLSRIALANTYGKPTTLFSGPSFSSLTVEGNKARLHFQHTDGGLAAKPLPATYQPNTNAPLTVPLVRTSPGGDLEGFAVCGADHVWKWATASIDGDTVVAWSDQVPTPIAVRYAWDNFPYCNLYNGAGLPAGPFRTDDFPLMSVKARYPQP